MSDPRKPYYKELDFKSARDLCNQLFDYAVENDLSYYQLEAYIYNNDLHREAALLSIPEYRNLIRTAVNKRFYRDGEKWNDVHGIDAVFAKVDYTERHGIKEKQPSFTRADTLRKLVQRNSL